MEIRRILVAVDFSACSAVAVAYAAELGRALGAQIHVLHVTGASGAMRRGVDAAKELERLVVELRDEGCAISSQLRSGRPVEEIVSEAADGPYDLIVMGTRGQRGLARLLSRSTAEAVIRRSPCPVVVVREGSTLCRGILGEFSSALRHTMGAGEPSIDAHCAGTAGTSTSSRSSG